MLYLPRHDLYPDSLKMHYRSKRILDLGTGDGRLIKLIRANRPQIEAVAIDVSPTMLRSAREHFANDSKVRIIEHDLSQPLPDDLGYFDAVVSSFAIHHLRHERKRERPLTWQRRGHQIEVVFTNLSKNDDFISDNK